MGKLNFWQWLGVVLLIVGIVWYVLRPGPDKDKNKPNPAQPAPTPAQPATLPATQAGG